MRSRELWVSNGPRLLLLTRAALENFADYPQQGAYTRGVVSVLLYQRKETKDALNIPV